MSFTSETLPCYWMHHFQKTTPIHSAHIHTQHLLYTILLLQGYVGEPQKKKKTSA